MRTRGNGFATSVQPIQDESARPRRLARVKGGAGLFAVLLLVAATACGQRLGAEPSVVPTAESPAASPLPTISPSPSSTPSETWLTYTDATYGYSLDYPPDFLFEQIPSRADFYTGELRVVRFFDQRFKGRYPGGQIEVVLYEKDSSTLDQWLDDHSRSSNSPRDNSTYFRDVADRRAVIGPSDKGALSFAWSTSEGGEGNVALHTTAFFHQTHVVALSWYVHDQAYEGTLVPVFNRMMSSWKD